VIPGGPRLRRLIRWLAWLVAGCVAGSVAAVVAYRYLDPPVTPLMLIRVVESRLAGRPVGIAKRWVPLATVSPAVVRAVIAAEDARFFVHHGFDWDAIERAREHNARHPRRLHGASTITMQCARNVFLWPGRTWVRKAIEAWFAALIELVWGKARILEVYLNVVEWGRGVYGVDEAARRAFGVGAASVTAQQAALLAAVLPDPRRLDPARPSAYVRARAAAIAARAR
jgi:monofunctional glycosyltransferase